MQRLVVQHNGVVPAACEAAWRVLRDWAGLARWWPEDAPFPVLRCEPIGDPAQLPFGRRLHVPGGGMVDEQLIFADEKLRRVYYYIDNATAQGFSNYLATATVDDAGEGRSTIGLLVCLDVHDGVDPAAIEGLVKAVLDANVRGIGRAAEHDGR
ncbi:hypothetical protein RHAL1_01728 [Beijerinckiaceae bacterium RH AL1]|nr:SRPBCC family protein [Beijerinckiaceae bacterium]VVB45362.1 hypothetical protein RHCH11_RHCH11_01691 [Beijerinckiaceae bacterium RH CH11]VVB45440.1 hypothetical protein RHAL8_01687 [Beijerinckiaceae bacterium RH AL8]VVC54827.1 hypothetical protein RHAL1_01728 [Beijerinckiaceae bacterium RH AL1]